MLFNPTGLGRMQLKECPPHNLAFGMDFSSLCGSPATCGVHQVPPNAGSLAIASLSSRNATQRLGASMGIHRQDECDPSVYMGDGWRFLILHSNL